MFNIYIEHRKRWDSQCEWVIFSSTTLGDICLHVETVRSKKLSEVVPQYSCLLLSPANLWQLDVHRYHDDTSLINTIYSHQVISCYIYPVLHSILSPLSQLLNYCSSHLVSRYLSVEINSPVTSFTSLMLLSSPHL